MEIVTGVSISNETFLETDNSENFTDVRFKILLCVIIAISLPVSLASFMGALKSSLRQEENIINCIIVFYNFGILQTCLISQVCMLVRDFAWKTDAINVAAACYSIHFSMAFGSTAIQAGLTAVTVIRYIYVFWPKIGFKINSGPKTVRICSAVVLPGLGIGRGIADYYVNDSSLFQRCMAESLNSYIAEERYYFVGAFFGAIMVLDFVLTWKIWRSFHKTRFQVAVLSTSALAKRRQKNLLTFRGSFVCRVVSLVPIAPSLLIVEIIRPHESLLAGYSAFLYSLTSYNICITILFPLTCLYHSPFVLEEVTKYVCIVE